MVRCCVWALMQLAGAAFKKPEADVESLELSVKKIDVETQSEIRVAPEAGRPSAR